MNKNIKIIFAIIAVITVMAFSGCRIGAVEEPAIVETSAPEKDIEESGPEEPEGEVSPEKEDNEAEEEEQDTDKVLDEDMLMDALIDFFNAVIQDNEYEYFSSGTISIVGSENEYKNGDKSDFYFIIKESHSNWENIEFEDIVIVDDRATIKITGDRMAEGMKYEDEKVEFDFIKENGEWKIDFSF